MSDSIYEIKLEENGLHSFIRGLQTFIKYEKGNKSDDFLLKEAIMFLHHGIELLMKQILINKAGESLIFSDVSQAHVINSIIKAKKDNRSVFEGEKAPNTASYEQSLKRIMAFVEKPQLEESLYSKLEALNGFRNDLMHYGISENKSTIETHLRNIKDPLTNFFKEGGIQFGTDYTNSWNEAEKMLFFELYSRFEQFINQVGSDLKVTEFPLLLDKKWNYLENLSNIDQSEKNTAELKKLMVFKSSLDDGIPTNEPSIPLYMSSIQKLMEKLSEIHAFIAVKNYFNRINHEITSHIDGFNFEITNGEYAPIFFDVKYLEKPSNTEYIDQILEKCTNHSTNPNQHYIILTYEQMPGNFYNQFQNELGKMKLEKISQTTRIRVYDINWRSTRIQEYLDDLLRAIGREKYPHGTKW